MNTREIIANAARRIESMFPGYFPQAKHNHYKDFSYPEHLTFPLLYGMYDRNGIAAAGVDKTILKTWEDDPEIWESNKPKESQVEGDIRQRFDDLRLWQVFAEADTRSMVGGYAGVILRLADGKRFQEPVDRVSGGLDGLVEVIPAWAEQLTVAEWDTDDRSDNYGKPKMFAFNEAALGGDPGKTRIFNVHPDRVIVWSTDGTVHARSALRAGFNCLLDMEKISGAGGEGFWKNAKSGFSIEIDKDAKISDMAAAMGVAPNEVADAVTEQVEGFNKGFDAALMTQGMKVTTMGVTLPSPEHFFAAPLQAFAASIGIPIKILIGNVTGERASTEDARDWAKTNMARRNKIAKPTIHEFIRRLERFGILRDVDWVIGWSDLTEATQGERIERASKMAAINATQGPMGEPVYTLDEIREVTGHETLGDIGGDDE